MTAQPTAKSEAPPRRPGAASLGASALKLLAFGVGLYALAAASLLANNSFGGVATIWPVNAVVFAALMMRPARHWPAIVAMAFPAYVAAAVSANLVEGVALNLAAVALSACNLIESLAGAGVLRAAAGPRLDPGKPRDLILFGVICLAAPLLSGSLAAVFLTLDGRPNVTHAFQTWVLADILSLVVVAPAMLLAGYGSLSPLFSRAQRWRTLAAFAAQAALITVVSLSDLAGLRSLIFAAFTIPAFALGVTGAAVGALLGSFLVLGFAAMGPGFAHLSGVELVRQGAILQAFLAVTNIIVIGFAATQQARRIAEARLAESELGFRQIAENTRDLILRYDRDGTITYASPSARSLGYRPEDLVGRNMADFTHPEDDVRARVIREQLSRGEAVDRSTLPMSLALRADGGLAWLEGLGDPIRDASGEVVGVVTVLRDVTQRVAMEAELRAKTAEAEAAARAKSEFLANMSHEIRTPLTAVLGFTGLLEALPDLPATARAYAGRIATSGQALLSVVNDILDFSKLEAQRVELDPHPFDPAGLVAESATLFAAEAERKGLTLHTRIDGGVPAAVLADSARVRQVLLNLLSNAIKFTAAGGVQVTLSHADDVLRVSVSDTGIGIPPERADRLFQRFSQVDGSNTRLHGGTGLGLAISKSLVDLMGGRIGAEQGEAGGSTFWFTAAAPVAEPVQAEPAATAPSPAEPAPAALEARILVVDDVAVNRELVRTMLAPFELDVVEAANGAEAVRSALSASFDLILMDLQMPGMDGLAATRAIRATSDLNRDTPILALSANVLPVHIAECREAGMDDHIAKPISPGELLTKIAAWTGSRDPASEEPAAEYMI